MPQCFRQVESGQLDEMGQTRFSLFVLLIWTSGSLADAPMTQGEARMAESDAPESEETLWDSEKKAWVTHGFVIRSPAGLVRFDHTKKEINSSIMVIGSGAKAYLHYIYETTSTKGTFVSLSAPGTASFSHLEVRLGDIRGYKTVFQLYGVPSDKRLLHMIVEDFVPHVDAIVVAAETEPDDVVQEAASRFVAAQRAIPVALLAPSSVADKWNSTTKGSPVFVATVADEQVFPSLKAVAKAILINIRNSPTGDPPSFAPQQSTTQKPGWRFW